MDKGKFLSLMAILIIIAAVIYWLMAGFDKAGKGPEVNANTPEKIADRGSFDLQRPPFLSE